MSHPLETCLDWVRENLPCVRVERIDTTSVLIGYYRVQWDTYHKWSVWESGAAAGYGLLHDQLSHVDAVSRALAYAVSEVFEQAME